jgi:uncharacterized protein DUF2721
MADPANPFAALTLIVAPAVLTNASSVLVLSTSNRLARAVDRARTLAAGLERPRAEPEPFGEFRLREMGTSERRALMLLQALRYFYGAIGGFAASALISLIGAAAAIRPAAEAYRIFEIVAIAAGFLAVSSLVLGCLTLLRETKLAVGTMSEEAALLRENLKGRR